MEPNEPRPAPGEVVPPAAAPSTQNLPANSPPTAPVANPAQPMPGSYQSATSQQSKTWVKIAVAILAVITVIAFTIPSAGGLLYLTILGFVVLAVYEHVSAKPLNSQGKPVNPLVQAFKVLAYAGLAVCMVIGALFVFLLIGLSSSGGKGS